MQASTIPGKQLPSNLSEACTSLQTLTITNNDSARLAEQRTNQVAPASCSELQINSLGGGKVLLSRPLSFNSSSVYVTSSKPKNPITLDMNGETLAVSAPAYMTISPDVYLSNVPLLAIATNLTLQGKTESWAGVTQVTNSNSVLGFDIQNSPSNSQIFSADISVETPILDSLGTATFSLQSSQHKNPVLELRGLINDMGLSSQVVFTGTQDAITSYHPTFALSGDSNSWTGGTIIQGVHLIIKTTGALPANGDILLNLGSASALPTLTFALHPTETYDAMGSIGGDNWGTIEVTTGKIHFGGNISNNNLILTGGNTKLSGLNALQLLLIKSGASLEVSSTRNLYNATSTYEKTIFEGGTLSLTSNALVEFTPTSSPTLRTGSTDTPFTISTGDNARAVFSILQIEESSALAIQGTGETVIENISFLDIGNPIDLTISNSGPLSGPLSIESPTKARNNVTFTSSPALDSRSINTKEASLSEGLSAEASMNLENLLVSGNLSVCIKQEMKIEADMAVKQRATVLLESKIYGQFLDLEDSAVFNLSNSGTVNAQVVSVGPGSILEGTGIINATTTHVEGILQPGSSPTNLTINGDVFLRPHSVFSEYIEPGASATLTVQEGLAIDSDVSLKIRALPGSYARSGENFTFAEANSVSGTFDSINMNTVMLTSTVSYTDNAITLHVMPTALTSIAKNGNAHTIAKNIDENLDSGNTKLCNLITDFFRYLKRRFAILFTIYNPLN